MRKKMMSAMVALMLASMMSAEAVNPNRGGVMGFVAGCCFGIRSGAAYNDGKDIHWREWLRIVPVVSYVVGIWDGIDAANGMTTSDYAAKYGAAFY